MLKTDMGTSFSRAISLIDNYWKVVEFPERDEYGLAAPSSTPPRGRRALPHLAASGLPVREILLLVARQRVDRNAGRGEL